MKKSSMGYSAVPSAETGGSDEDKVHDDAPRWQKPAVLTSLAAVLLACGISIGWSLNPSSLQKSSTAALAGGGDGATGARSALPLPTAVNLGSWLSLEDYFYVGTHGAVEVATPDDLKPAGACLPPLHTGPATGPKWNAETDLFANLTQGTSLRQAIKVFHAFRVSYLDFDEELGQMARAGIKKVRVPMSWCHTEHDPENDDILSREASGEDGKDTGEDAAELERRYTCKDPFFGGDNDQGGDEVVWPAVPRSLLVRFLRSCARHGLKATLDIHTYPGGTSLGTFSGVWPRSPLFWKYDDPANPQSDVGRKTYREILSWIESLADTDPEALRGVGAVTPMNEPAHLAGLFGEGGPWEGQESFLPPLQKKMAEEYVSEMAKDAAASGLDAVAPVHDGVHLRVLMWQRDAVRAFRESSLPSLGIECAVNVHESILVPSLVPDDGNDEGGRHPQGTAIMASWWRTATTAEERSTWAVLDMHHYHAWEPTCQGASVGPPDGSYTCGDARGTEEVLGRCASWAGMYRNAATAQMGESPRPHLASAEFSASTHHSVLKSCLDATTLRRTYLAQVQAAEEAGVELYWWSWKMPHGGTFRRAWSFKHFLHLMGAGGIEGPDEPDVPCG